MTTRMQVEAAAKAFLETSELDALIEGARNDAPAIITALLALVAAGDRLEKAVEQMSGESITVEAQIELSAALAAWRGANERGTSLLALVAAGDELYGVAEYAFALTTAVDNPLGDAPEVSALRYRLIASIAAWRRAKGE